MQIFEGLAGLILLGFFGLLYFTPTIIAYYRDKTNKIPILALNFFLGWSLVGWVVSLVWALSQDQRTVIVQQTFQQATAVPPLEQKLD